MTENKSSEITELTHDDVLCGRGSGVNFFTGNKRFRDLCETFKEEYNSTNKHRDKTKIANEVVQEIRKRGGRFLDLQSISEDTDSVVEDGMWQEIDEKKALDKVKQTLRQQHKVSSRKAKTRGANSDIPAIVDSRILPVLPTPLVSSLTPSLLQSTSLMMNPYLHAAAILPTERERLISSHPAQYAPILFVPPTLVPSACPADIQSAGLTTEQPVSMHLTTASTSGQSLEIGNDSAITATTHDISKRKEATYPVNGAGIVSPMQGMDDDDEDANKAENDDADDDDDVSDFLQSVLVFQLSSLPKFTDHEKERSQMTDEEKASALSDIFGKYCNVDTPANKRRRRDLDNESVAFLIRHMRTELDKIPNDQKQALLEAQAKCIPEEFSDARLERFLRCCEMDATLAAKRFVNYWKCRKEVFGNDKFTLRMTLSEALRDDLKALEAGWLCLLPNLDASGRQLLCLEPARHTKEGYTTRSLLRAAWYVIEVSSRSNTHMRSGVVEVVWDKESSVWEYDHELYTRHAYFESNCFPLRFDCFHVCCTPKFVARVIAPVASAWQGKSARTRSIWHDVPEEKILTALSEYGITASMLPEVFGGSIRLDQSEWIVQRRSLEMEEIE